jgi:hypothetical protein
MTKQDNGGPAFPTCESDGDFGWQPVGGMTLLDYFAAKSLRGTALLTVPVAEEIAKDAYAIATAMLAEKRRREKED